MSAQLFAQENKSLIAKPLEDLASTSVSSSVWQMALGLLFVLAIIFFTDMVDEASHWFSGNETAYKSN